MTEPQTPDQPDQAQLDELGREIDDIRDRVDDPLDQGDATFIEGGDSNPENKDLQDDTIVPPG